MTIFLATVTIALATIALVLARKRQAADKTRIPGRRSGDDPRLDEAVPHSSGVLTEQHDADTGRVL